MYIYTDVYNTQCTDICVCVCALTSQRESSIVNQVLKFYFKVVQNINYWLHQLRGILLWSPYVNLYILPFPFKRGKKKKRHNESKKQNPAQSSTFKQWHRQGEGKPNLPLPRSPLASSPRALPQPWPCACLISYSSRPIRTAASPQLHRWGQPNDQQKWVPAMSHETVT